jgi:hypothetical protein
VNATSGVAVGTDTPNALATLTVNGDLRIQPNVADTNICNATTKGTMKSVNTTGGQLCACFCDGRAWQASLETPSCIRACDTNKQGLNALDKICDTKIRSATENHRFEPAWDSSLLGNTGGCTTGISLPQTSYFYATGINGSGITTHYRTCVEPKKAEFVECNSSFSCQKDPKFTLNTGSLVCSYSTTDPSEGKKDDRGLRENVNKKLIGTLGHQCKNATETPAELNNPSNQNQNCTNSNPVDDDSSQKCQFYCQNGWHKETKNGVDICIENSCGAQVVTHTQNWADTTKQVPYSVPCLDHGESKNIPYTTSLPNGTTITYTKNFSCKEGTLLSGAVQYTIESCNTGYHPFPLANNYIGSYRCDANQYKIDYYRDYTNGNNSPLTTQTQTYDTSFSLAGNFNRVGYTLKGWSTTQQKLWNIAKQSVSNYSPIPSFTAKEGSRTLNLSAPATWNFTANKTYPNYSTSNPEIFPLYAVWQRNSYTVTFQAGSGTLYGAGGSCAGDNSIRGWSIDQSTWLNTLSGMQAAAKPNILAVSGTLADKYPTAPTSCGTPSSVNSSCVSQGNVSLP